MELFCLPTLSLCKALRTLFCWFHNDVISVLAPLTQPIFQRFHSELLNFNNFYQMILSPLVFFSLQRKKKKNSFRPCNQVLNISHSSDMNLLCSFYQQTLYQLYIINCLKMILLVIIELKSLKYCLGSNVL